MAHSDSKISLSEVKFNLGFGFTSREPLDPKIGKWEISYVKRVKVSDGKKVDTEQKFEPTVCKSEDWQMDKMSEFQKTVTTKGLYCGNKAF
jgi:hypothetical protein